MGHLRFFICDRSLQERLANIAAQSKRQLPVSAGVGGASKRLKTDDSNTSGTTEHTAAMLSYLKQKSELEAQAGGSGEDSAKWYVR